MPKAYRLRWARIERTALEIAVHSARTAVAALISFVVARLFRLPEAYWAPITTLVITQSSFGAALSVSWERIIGTVLGAAVGVAIAIYFKSNIFIFAAGVFVLGILCALARADRSAYRFAGITLAIVILIPRTNPPWQVAWHRCAEVLIGIGVALLLAVVWPESEETATGKT